MIEFSYRLGRLEDKENLQKLGLSSYGQFEQVLSEDNWGKMNDFLTSENSYNDLLSNSQCFVCETKNKIIGMAFLVPNGNPTDIFDKDWCYIRMVGVDPEFTGNGIAKNLTQMCIDYAKQAGEKTITLHTSEFMDAARHIYEGLGFEKVKELNPLFGKKYWLYELKIN